MKRLFFILVWCAMQSVYADFYPFYETVCGTNGASFTAVRPFYSRSETEERWQRDYLWPLFTQKGFKEETYARFLFLGWHADFPGPRERTWLLPFYYQGTAQDGTNYAALFPFGGRICEFLGRDQVEFALFPLLARSRVNDVKTLSVLWPIFSRTQGDRVERFRVWPLYGTSQLEGEYRKRFICWPLYTSVKFTNPRNPGGGYILFPFYGRVTTDKATNRWYLPPFFRFSEGGGQRIIYAPWPFIQRSDGDVQKRYLWPLVGTKKVGTVTRNFWAWPIIWNSRVEYTDHDVMRRNVLPFYYSEKKVVTRSSEKSDVGEVAERYWKIWPLMSWERTEEASRFRLLELWPLRRMAGIERNWAPLWTLYRRAENDQGVEHRLLWGLGELEKGAGKTKWSLLKGVLGYRNEDDNRSIQVLFFRFKL